MEHIDAFYYMEYGSVVPGFSDSDMGGPNTKGHKLDLTYNIDDFLTIGGTMILAQPIHTNDNPLNGSNVVAFPHNQDMTATFMLDLVWKF